MPNWCSNFITFHGPADALKALADHVRSDVSGFDFNSIVPMPEVLAEIRTGSTTIDGVQFRCWREVEDGQGGKKSVGLTPEEVRALDAQHGAHDWYEWSCKNWGTKWNVDQVSLSPANDGASLQCGFETAWSPPTPVVETLASRFPQVTIIHCYAEEGVGFGAVVRYANGIMEEATEAEGRGVRTLSEWHESVTCGDMDDEDEEIEEDNEEEE